MAIPRKPLNTLRKLAFHAQDGKCYYCCQPMWNDEDHLPSFARKYRLSTPQAGLLRSTGEHLLPHKDGGKAEEVNIVAACSFCNTHRHRRKAETSVSKYKELVRKRLNMGRWHGLSLG